MILRQDHVAGVAFVVAGVAILAVSHDLPLGTLASPGAGLLPTLVLALMILFGLILVAKAGSSPPLSKVDWSDLPHAARIVVVAAAVTTAYTTLGFLLAMACLLFILTFVVERQNVIVSAILSILLPLVTYALFEHLLKTPLEHGLFWF